MLGSLADAEDALQDTLLAAWQGLAGFEGRASLRTRLYRIATNRCLNARRSASRRPAKEWDIPGVQPPEPTRLGEVVWLEPFPDTLRGPAWSAGSRRPSAASRLPPSAHQLRTPSSRSSSVRGSPPILTRLWPC
jgi:RNA polymerase sigma-70 factor (ECF subfamily)